MWYLSRGKLQRPPTADCMLTFIQAQFGGGFAGLSEYKEVYKWWRCLYCLHGLITSEFFHHSVVNHLYLITRFQTPISVRRAVWDDMLDVDSQERCVHSSSENQAQVMCPHEYDYLTFLERSDI